jgi:broad specificity phosphatase PhoE
VAPRQARWCEDARLHHPRWRFRPQELGVFSAPSEIEENPSDFDPPWANRIQRDLLRHPHDPGVRDPHLTDRGRRQARAVAQVLLSFNLSRFITSPYARALETAGIIAERLDLLITVEPLIAERFSFICNIGAPLAELHTCWPDLAFDHLQVPWSSQTEESEGMIWERCQSFRRWIAGEPWLQIGVVTHWGFIRALTGLKVPNGAVLRVDPTRPGARAAFCARRRLGSGPTVDAPSRSVLGQRSAVLGRR